MSLHNFLCVSEIKKQPTNIDTEIMTANIMLKISSLVNFVLSVGFPNLK